MDNHTHQKQDVSSAKSQELQDITTIESFGLPEPIDPPQRKQTGCLEMMIVENEIQLPKLP